MTIIQGTEKKRYYDTWGIERSGQDAKELKWSFSLVKHASLSVYKKILFTMN